MKMLYLYQDLIISNLMKYGNNDKNLQDIVIYGSFVRNEHGPDSDLDILIITNNISESEIIFSKFRKDIYTKTSIPISFYYISPIDYLRRRDPFISQIKKEGQILWSVSKIT